MLIIYGLIKYRNQEALEEIIYMMKSPAGKINTDYPQHDSNSKPNHKRKLEVTHDVDMENSDSETVDLGIEAPKKKGKMPSHLLPQSNSIKVNNSSEAEQFVTNLYMLVNKQVAVSPLDFQLRKPLLLFIATHILPHCKDTKLIQNGWTNEMEDMAQILIDSNFNLRIRLLNIIKHHGENQCCDFNQLDCNKQSWLHDAARLGMADCMQLLIEYGGDLKIENQFKQTPLHVATSYQNSDVIKVLLIETLNLARRNLDEGVIDWKDLAGFTPLRISEAFHDQSSSKYIINAKEKMRQVTCERLAQSGTNPYSNGMHSSISPLDKFNGGHNDRNEGRDCKMD